MKKFDETIKYIRSFIKWIIIAGVVGLTGGVVGGIFHRLIEYATHFRGETPYLLYFLPLGGVIIVFLYKLSGLEKDPGTNVIISSVSKGDKVPFLMAPLIFISTIITHMLGGSAGREGAALQLGGSMAYRIGKLFKLNEVEMHTIVMCGMSAVFSALFCTPVTAAIFAIEVISVGLFYYSSILPCFFASYIACIISLMLGNEAPAFIITNIPDFSFDIIFKVIIAGIVFALVSISECKIFHESHKLLEKYFPNRYFRIIFGGILIIIMTLLIGNRDYNGAGMDVITRAIGGNVIWYAFILKILFTAITLGSGFKGGEIVPTFFIGATLGCAIGNIVGLDSGFCAALGLISVFCGVVNCPVSSIILSIELFGSDGIVFFALSCAVCYMMSGKSSLYSSQKFINSKIDM